MQQQQVPQEFQRAYVLEGLINLDLVAQAARDAKIDQGDDYKQLLSYFSDRALQRVFLLKTVVPQMSGDTLKAAYDQYVKAVQPQDELHARHIQEKTQAEAQDIKKQLDGGAKFEDIAKAKSIDTGSGANGGDLGFFARGQMVKPFEDAAFALKVGEVSQPVQSQFGWHIIRVDEVRKTQPAPFEQISPAAAQQVLFTKKFSMPSRRRSSRSWSPFPTPTRRSPPWRRRKRKARPSDPGGRTAAGAPKMAGPVSPLAPKDLSGAPGDCRGALRDGRGGDQIQGPHRRAARLV